MTARAVADRLGHAERTREPCAPVATMLGDAPDALDRAYEAQTLSLAARLASGERLVGRKIGLTSAAVRRQLGVDSPDFGFLTDAMAYADGAVIAAGAVMQPRAEAEVALVLGHAIEMPNATMADVISACAYALPAIEICGSRIADWRITLLDTVADNASAGAFVLGGSPRLLTGIDLRAVTMRMTRHGVPVSDGTGRDCMGHPLAAAVWLAREMVRRGTPLRAGDIVLTGALGPMVPCAPGDVFEAEIAGLGSVGLTMAAARHASDA